MYLHGPSALRIDPGELATLVRAQFGNELRRVGGYSQIGLLGAQACLARSGGAEPIAVLCASERGALHETRAALGEELQQGEASMPFTFIATQPHLAGVLLAQRGHVVTRVAHLHLAAHAWPWLFAIARGWLAAQECAVLAGWVEEAAAPAATHRSDWCVLRNEPAAGAIRCAVADDDEPQAQRAAHDWMQRIAAWRAHAQPVLTLRGSGGTWRFSAG